MSVPVVVGAYPSRSSHGSTSVVPVGVGAGASAARSPAQVHGTVDAQAADAANYIVISATFAPEHGAHPAASGRASCSSSAPRVARRLAADPTALRYRYGDAR